MGILERIIACVVVVSGFASCSETAIRPIPPSDEVEGGEADVLTPSPWDGIASLQVPEQYFFVAWADRLAPRDIPEGIGVIDLFGNVIVGYPFPGWQGEHRSYELSDFSEAEFFPGATGQVLVQLDLPTVLDPADAEPWDRLIWRLDLVEEVWTLVAKDSRANGLDLPLSGAHINTVEGAELVNVAADVNDPDLLFVVRTGANTGAHWQLSRVHLSDASVQPVTWSESDVFAHDTRIDSAYSAPIIQLGVDDDGDSAVVFQASTPPIAGEPGPYDLRWHVFSADRGPLDWRFVVPVFDVTDESYVGLPIGLDAAGQLLDGLTLTLLEDQGFNLATNTEVWWIDLGYALYEATPGPILDPINHTFVYVEHDWQHDGELSTDKIFISHRGEDVWEIDRFHQGFESTPFALTALLAADVGGGATGE